MLPNWIIVGAPKAGTTSLFRWLIDHPEVAGSVEKETYYFVDPGTHMYRRDHNVRETGLEGYQKLFRHCDPSARVVIESTPGYIYSATALEELPNLPSRPEFIFLLREPVEQLKSLFSYFQENWNWIPRGMTLREFVTAVDRGTSRFRGNELASSALNNADYIEHLRRWRDVCGRERMHVFLFEEMLKDKRQFMRSLARRMRIDQSFYDDYGFPAENVSYAVRSGLLQIVNIRVRAIIPKGAMYRALRRVYRAANTKAAPSSRVRDLEVERILSKRYLASLDQLECEFDLDMTSWRHALMARLVSDDEQLPVRRTGLVPRSGYDSASSMRGAER